jgi:hypothetical protein
MNWIDWAELRRQGEYVRYDLVEGDGNYSIQERKGHPDAWSAPAVHDFGNNLSVAQDEMTRFVRQRQSEGWIL